MKIPSARAFLFMLSLLVAPKLLPQTSTPDFGIKVSADNGKVLQGDSASYNITITPKNGFNSDVTIQPSNAPKDATYTCSPSCTVRGGSGVATVLIATAKVTPGNYPSFTITGNNIHPQPAPLEVCGFQLSATPSRSVVMPGGRAVFAVTLKRIDFTGPIHLSASPKQPETAEPSRNAKENGTRANPAYIGFSPRLYWR